MSTPPTIEEARQLLIDESGYRIQEYRELIIINNEEIAQLEADIRKEQANQRKLRNGELVPHDFRE